MAPADSRRGACGLDCTACDQYRFATDAVVQEKLLRWYREKGWLPAEEGLETALAKGMYCKGCGDPEVCWSSDCRILQCCQHERGYRDCSLCPDLSCARLAEHAARSERYGEGLRFLKAARNGRPSSASPGT